MKNVKKIMSLLLVMALALVMATAGFAESGTNSNNGQITIDNAVDGQTYTVYQILTLESYNTGDNAYAYKANSNWATWLKTQTTYVSIDDDGYVTWVKNADAAAFAKAAQAYAKENNIAATASKKATGTTVSFTGLNLGYYLVDTTLGTLCSLDTTDPAVTIKEKNEAPTVEKKVQEDSTGDWGKTNDADISQTVNFQATITVQAGAENYILHDTMSAGLTLDASSIKVQVNKTDVATANYTVTTSGLTDGCTFEVAFADNYIASLAAGTEIVISYSATLNENAVVGLNGNANTIKLEYGDENQSTLTPSDQTITYTWDMDILKYANGDETKVLADAQFVLLNEEKTEVATIVNGKLIGWVDVPTAGKDGVISWPANTTLTTDAKGKIEIDGLDADTYYLREVKAPTGYNILNQDVKVVIIGATADTNGQLTYSTVEAKVNNQSGAELPSTGGMGTTIFYVIGGVLVVGAMVVLITKKRMKMN